jgi:hypothetical protein
MPALPATIRREVHPASAAQPVLMIANTRLDIIRTKRMRDYESVVTRCTDFSGMAVDFD